jgi:cytoskeleton protein RodZ
VRLLLERINSPITFAVVLVLFLALNGFLFYRYQQALQSPGDETANAPVEDEEASPSLEEESTVTEETSSSVEEEEETTATEETTSSPVEEQGGGVQVLVSVVNEPIGLSVRVDGLVVYDEVTNPGFSEEFEAEEAVTVEAADGGAVLVSVDGANPEPLGLSEEPASRTFTPEPES